MQRDPPYSGADAPPAASPALWWMPPLILALTLACYWPALRGELVWDDAAHITRPDLRSAAGLWRIWSDPRATQQYYPLLHTAFWLEHRLWGDATLGYHLANVLLHAGAACLLVLALRRLGVPGAPLAGLLFAVHPVCVESVAWISEQKNTLSLVFYLLAAIAYLGFCRRRGRPAARGAYLLATLLFVLALLTKTVTATLPAALLVVLWWRQGRLSWRRDAVPLLPWFALSAAGGLVTAVVERRLVGAEGAGFDLTALERCLLAGRAIGFYLGKLLWPSNLLFVYPHWDVPAAAGGWAGYLCAALLVTAALWTVSGRTRGPLAAWLFFGGSLFPALGFFNVYPFLFSYVADHFQYLASIGILTAASAGAAALLGRASPALRAAGLAAAAALVAALAALSNAQSRIYSDPFTLYTATLAGNPGCWMARNNLGVWYEERGEREEATAQYQEALRLNADYAAAHDNLGAILLKVPGRLDDAIFHLQEALRIKPDFVDAHASLGNAWMQKPGRLADAAAEYRRALRTRPGFAEAHNGLGNALAALGRTDEAVAEYREALRLRPAYAEIHFNLAMALLNAPGRRGEAAEQLEEFLLARPGNEAAWRILGQIRADRPAPP